RLWHTEYWLESAKRSRPPAFLPVPLQRIRIGPLQWIGLGGEVLHHLGLLVKEADLHHTTMVVSYANGNLGYLPSAKDIMNGGYEVGFSSVVYNHYPYSTDAESAVLNGLKRLESQNQ